MNEPVSWPSPAPPRASCRRRRRNPARPRTARRRTPRPHRLAPPLCAGTALKQHVFPRIASRFQRCGWKCQLPLKNACFKNVDLPSRMCFWSLYLSANDFLQNSQLCRDILCWRRRCRSSSSLQEMVNVQSGHANTVTVVGCSSTGGVHSSFGGRPLLLRCVASETEDSDLTRSKHQELKSHGCWPDPPLGRW